MVDGSSLDGPFSVFPVMRHAHRTVGFFKVRGINVNHAEFEDFVFRIPEINDFQVELRNDGGADIFHVAIEVRRGSEAGAVAGGLAGKVRATFEVRPEIEVLETGTLARAFESSVKAPRFVDRR